MQKNNKAIVATVIKQVASKMAKVSCGAASVWGLHQIKEPKPCKKA